MLYIYYNEFSTHEKCQIDSLEDWIPLFHRQSMEKNFARFLWGPTNVFAQSCSLASVSNLPLYQMILEYAKNPRYSEAHRLQLTQIRTVRHLNRSYGARSLEVLKARLDGALGSLAGGGQPCPWHGVGLGELWHLFQPKPFYNFTKSLEALISYRKIVQAIPHQGHCDFKNTSTSNPASLAET